MLCVQKMVHGKEFPIQRRTNIFGKKQMYLLSLLPRIQFTNSSVFSEASTTLHNRLWGFCSQPEQKTKKEFPNYIMPEVFSLL